MWRLSIEPKLNQVEEATLTYPNGSPLPLIGVSIVELRQRPQTWLFRSVGAHRYEWRDLETGDQTVERPEWRKTSTVL